MNEVKQTAQLIDAQTQRIERIVNDKLQTLKQAYENKLADLESMNQSLRADLLHLQHMHNQYRDIANTGRASQARLTLSKEDLTDALEAKIEQSSLREIVETVYAEKGINIDDEKQWLAVIDPENHGPSIAQMAKRGGA